MLYSFYGHGFYLNNNVAFSLYIIIEAFIRYFFNSLFFLFLIDKKIQPALYVCPFAACERKDRAR